jgi:hypothetical protein
MKPNLKAGRRGGVARAGMGLIVFGFFVFAFGRFPGLLGLDITPDIGILQITVFLFGITLMTLGAYVYMREATRHLAQPRRLREDVGVRLMATGVVATYVTGFADVLGIGSHFGAERPLFGALQAWGVALGVLVILTGIFIYSRK